MRPSDVLAHYGLSPKKSWGQNFLSDARMVARIADASGASSDDVVLEIGAGLGAMTVALAARAGRVLAVEHDPDMVRVLRSELAALTNLTIVARDALTLDYARIASEAGRPLVVAGNLPYQITSPLLFGIIDGAGQGKIIRRAIVMVQKEFADRAAAPPGDKTYGRLSVMVQQFAAARVLFDVSPAAFTPQPRVWSAVMEIVPRDQPLAPVLDRPRFAEVVRAAFGTRRKMLKNALETAFERDTVARALAEAHIDGARRAETLAVAEFAAVSNAIVRAPAGHGE